MNPEREPPLRLKVILALQKLIEGATVADGYAFDLAGKVFRNRILIGAEITDRPPAVAIVEAPRADIATFAGEEEQWRRDYWTIMIQGIARDDRKDTTDDIYFLCQDVERRLNRMQEETRNGRPEHKEDYRLGGMITGVDIAPPVIRPPEAGVANNAFFYLAIRLGMAAKIGE